MYKRIRVPVAGSAGGGPGFAGARKRQERFSMMALCAAERRPHHSTKTGVRSPAAAL